MRLKWNNVFFIHICISNVETIARHSAIVQQWFLRIFLYVIIRKPMLGHHLRRIAYCIYFFDNLGRNAPTALHPQTQMQIE